MAQRTSTKVNEPEVLTPSQDAVIDLLAGSTRQRRPLAAWLLKPFHAGTTTCSCGDLAEPAPASLDAHATAANLAGRPDVEQGLDAGTCAVGAGAKSVDLGIGAAQKPRPAQWQRLLDAIANWGSERSG